MKSFFFNESFFSHVVFSDLPQVFSYFVLGFVTKVRYIYWLPLKQITCIEIDSNGKEWVICNRRLIYFKKFPKTKFCKLVWPSFFDLIDQFSIKPSK